jgi:hypothetical protein
MKHCTQGTDNFCVTNMADSCNSPGPVWTLPTTAVVTGFTLLLLHRGDMLTQKQFTTAVLLFLFLILLLCWVGVHCGIYKDSYNISNISHLNSPSPPFSFISPPPSQEIVSKDIFFSIYIHVYTVFAPNSPSQPFPYRRPPHTGINPPRQDLFLPPVLWFCCSLIFACLRLLHREFPCGTSKFICIIARFGSSPLFFFFLL